MNRPIIDALGDAGSLADYQVWPTGHLGNIEAGDRCLPIEAGTVSADGVSPWRTRIRS